MKRVLIDDKAYNVVKVLSEESGESITKIVTTALIMFFVALSDKDKNAKEKEEIN